MSARIAMFLDESMHTDSGYQPSMVRENEAGHYPMAYYWDTDYTTAKRLVDEANERLGLTPDDARDIIASSIAASNTN